jgi:hypothetical protein
MLLCWPTSASVTDIMIFMTFILITLNNLPAKHLDHSCNIPVTSDGGFFMVNSWEDHAIQYSISRCYFA